MCCAKNNISFIIPHITWIMRRSGLLVYSRLAGWKDGIAEVAATAASAMDDRKESENEGSDNKGEDDPEHDAVDDLHGSLTFFDKLTVKD